MVSNSEKRDKSLAEFVVIIILVGVLMGVFINYFYQQGAQFSDAGFKTLAQQFNTKVATVHAQWLMDKQPRVVKLAAVNNNEKQRVTVNKKGWIDVKQRSLVCEHIWQVVMESPLNFMKQTISAIEVRIFSEKASQKNNSVCRYVLPSGTYFDYNRFNGRVSAVVIATGS